MYITGFICFPEKEEGVKLNDTCDSHEQKNDNLLLSIHTEIHSVLDGPVSGRFMMSPYVSASDILVQRIIRLSHGIPLGPDEVETFAGMSVFDELKLWQLVEYGMPYMVTNLLHNSYPDIEEITCSRISQMLLSLEKDALQGAVLMAVDANVPHLVSLLLRRVKAKDWCESSRSTKFRLHNVSPLMLACLNNYFDVVAVLLSRDHKLPVPHNIRCRCGECVEWRDRDSLNRSKYIINLWRALCSPSFLWLACPDPLSAAAKMAYEMERQANDNPEFQLILRKCSIGCRELCGHIAKMLVKSSEIDIIITNMQPMQLVNASNYPGLELAIACHIKNFIVDPGVNAHLASIWRGSNGGDTWNTKRINIVAHVCYPITAPLYMLSGGILFPTYRTPFYRFVSYTTSYMIFLSLLIILMQDNDNKVAGWPHQKWKVAVQFYTWLYVHGMIASDIETVSSGTLRQFVEAWWHWLDCFAFATYMFSFYVWIRSAIANSNIVDVHRAHWPWWEPRLVFEASFSFGTMLSFWRLFYYFQLSKTFGPLIISIGRCIPPIMIHICIIMLETFAFSIAINGLYENYIGNVAVHEDGTIDRNPDYFTSVYWTIRWLYWTFYGYLAPREMRIVVGNAGKRVTEHYITSFIGELLIALYYAITIIILLNLLISIMVGTAKKVTENEAEEWLWERACIWNEFMQKHFTLPSPFNLIHIAFIKLSRVINFLAPKKKPPAYSNTEYEALMEDLFRRYMVFNQK